MMSTTEMTEQELKNHIKGIITSSPIVSTIQTIVKDYREMIGTAIPYQKFKYNSVEHFLKSIPDTCVVRGTGSYAQVTLVPSQKSAHINEMVQLQKVNTRGPRKFLAQRRRSVQANWGPSRRPPPWRPQYNYSISPNSSTSSSSSFGYPSTEPPTKTINNNVPCANSGDQNNTSLQRVPNTSTDVRNCTVQSTSTGIGNLNIQGTSKGASGESGHYIRRCLRGENSEERRNCILEHNKLESKKVKENLDRLIQEQLGNVIPSTSTPKKDTGLSNSSGKVPDNVWTKENQNKDDFKDRSSTIEDEYFNKSKEKLNNWLNNFKTDEVKEEDTSNVPKRVQLNLITLISQFMNGIWCGDLPKHYRLLFNKDLNYKEYGYTSLIDMCIALKNIFHYVRPEKDDFKLYDRSRPLPDNVEKQYTMASYSVGEKVTKPAALPDLEWEDFRWHIPQDILKLGNVITREFLPAGAKVDSVFDVVVTEIYDPSKFWFYLGKEDRQNELDKLMDRMQAFYTNPDNAKEYSIPPGAIKEGLYCVQVIYGEYHRARVMRVLPHDPDHVRVMYIDYGTVCKVTIKGMCFLRLEFAELNAQAIRCRLANIMPTLKGHPWLQKTSNRFRSLVTRRDTKIKVSYIDWDEEYVCVFLADVTDSDNILYLNEVLVKEHLAVWDGEPQVTPLVLSNFKCKVQSIHLFPTFVELEYALAPTASEMYALANMKVPLQFCIPQYFEPDEQILQIDVEQSMEEIENTFIDTIKNHKRSSFLDPIDISDALKPQPFDFDIFGELKEEMMEFCERDNLAAEAAETEAPVNDLEDELFRDVEEDETARIDLARFKDIDRQLEDCEPIALARRNKELTESIIHKLQKYSLLDSEHSSDSEPVAGTSRDVSDSGRSEHFDLQEELSQQESADELSTIFEQSEMEIDVSDAATSPKTPFSELVGLNRRHQRLDINIFDNPEEFEGDNSDDSEENENSLLGPTKSFLKTVEKRTTEVFEEEVEHVEDNICATENSTAIYSDTETTPCQFDISLELKDSELREAFLSFLKTHRPNSRNLSASGSSCPDQTRSGEESFLKCKEQGGSEQEEHIGGKRRRDDGSVREGGSVQGSEISMPSNRSLEERRKSFVSTLSLNNPFRSYLEAGASTDNLSTDATEYSTLAASVSTDSFTTKLAKTIPKLTDAKTSTPAAIASSDSEGSDYKVFVPRGTSQDRASATGSSETPVPNFANRFQRYETPPRFNNQRIGNAVPNQENTMAWVQNCMEARGINTPPRAETPPWLRNPNGGVTNQEWTGSWAQGTMPVRGMMTPPGMATPPRMFNAPGFVPPYASYTPWSNGTGYPVPQYTQWSNGGNQPPSGPHHLYRRDSLRPPPGFGYQGPPPNFNPHNMVPGRMVSPASMYPQGGPGYYGPPLPPRPMTVPTFENDFYDRYNERLLRHSNQPS